MLKLMLLSRTISMPGVFLGVPSRVGKLGPELPQAALTLFPNVVGGSGKMCFLAPAAVSVRFIGSVRVSRSVRKNSTDISSATATGLGLPKVESDPTNGRTEWETVPTVA